MDSANIIGMMIEQIAHHTSPYMNPSIYNSYLGINMIFTYSEQIIGRPQTEMILRATTQYTHTTKISYADLSGRFAMNIDEKFPGILQQISALHDLRT